ncbi:hypothetical protein Tco_0599414 [Tanacetum coccineum]
MGYNAVPPPSTGLFAPLIIDLSHSGIEKFKRNWESDSDDEDDKPKPKVVKKTVESKTVKQDVVSDEDRFNAVKDQHVGLDAKNRMDAQAQGRQECSKEKEESREECSKSRKTKKMKVKDPFNWNQQMVLQSSHNDGSKPSSDDGKKVDEDLRKDCEYNDQEKEDNVNSTNNVNAAGTNKVNAVGGKTSIELPFDPNMPALEDYSIFDFSRDDEDDGAEADMNNLDTPIQVSPNPTTRIHKDHPLDKVIGDLQSATQTRKMSKNLKEHGFVCTIQQRINHKDLQNCLFACFLSQEEPKKAIHAFEDPTMAKGYARKSFYIQVI